MTNRRPADRNSTGILKLFLSRQIQGTTDNQSHLINCICEDNRRGSDREDLSTRHQIICFNIIWSGNFGVTMFHRAQYNPVAYLTTNTLKLYHKTWLTEHIITLTVWSLNGWETSGNQSFMIRKQALESFCLVYFLATLLICTGCMVMAVYGEVEKMWLDITVTFTMLSQQLFAEPMENHEKCLTSQFLVWELKSGSRRNTTTV